MLVGNYNAQYVGKTMCGFINGHKYNINIHKDRYGYIIIGIYDNTEEINNDGYMNYASEISIRQNWIINETT